MANQKGKDDKTHPNDITVGTIRTLLLWIRALKKDRKDDSKYIVRNDKPIKWVFRGLSSDKYELIPSIARKEVNGVIGCLDDPKALKERLGQLEERLSLHLPSYITIPYRSMKNPKWIELFIGRHHGIPTPLLDFSRNSLVAFFNAVISKPNEDGIVYAVNVRGPEDKEDFDTSKANLFMYTRIPNDVLPYTSGEVFFVEPPYLDPRMIAQEAVFLFSQKKVEILDKVENRKFHWLNKKLKSPNDFNPNEIADQNTVIRFRIPKNRKEDIRNELNYIGINHSTLYPDLWGFGKFLNTKFLKDFDPIKKSSEDNE